MERKMGCKELEELACSLSLRRLKRELIMPKTVGLTY